VGVRKPEENDRLLNELADLLESGPTDGPSTSHGIGPQW
jgi:hypothetical protein